MVAAGETRLERLKRMLLHSGTRSAPVASGNADGTLGRMQTEDGRRTGRLTNLTTLSDDGTVEERGSKSPHEWGSTGMYVGSPDRTLPPRQVTAGNVTIEKSSDCVPSASLLPLGAGAPMAPEDSDGLDNYEVPSRTAAAGETQFERIRRILVYAGTRSASSSDGGVERLGTVLTAAGRRSARLTSSSATGGGTVNDDAETQAIILRNLQEERTVVERLRAALPPPARLSDIDFPETGGSALPGAEREVDYNEPLVRFATTTETVNDDSGAIGGTTQGTVEGAPTLEVLGLAAGHDGAAPRTMPGLLTMCANHERCGRALRTQAAPACCGAATCALARMAVDMQSTATPIRLIRMCLAALKWSWCSTTPRRRKCVFDAGQDTLNLVGASEWTLARSGARVGGLGGGGVGVLPATVLRPFKTDIPVARTSTMTGLWQWCGEAQNR